MTRYYGNFGKQDAADDFGAFYTEDAVFDVNGIVSTGREAIEAFYTDTGDDEEAPAAQGTFHMMISNPVIDVNGDSATATFFWTGVMNTAIEDRPQLWEQGREYDLLVRQDGEWRIKKRVVIADSGLPDRYMAHLHSRAWTTTFRPTSAVTCRAWSTLASFKAGARHQAPLIERERDDVRP